MPRTQYYTEHLFIGDVHQGRDTNRYYLSEYFTQLPQANGVGHTYANKNFEVLGTNASADDITFSSTEAGATITNRWSR